MAVYIGGSAFAMARDIAEGYILVSPTTIKKYQTADLTGLTVEIDKLTRETRGENPPAEDVAAIQQKNRKLQRLSQALMVIQNFQSKVRR